MEFGKLQSIDDVDFSLPLDRPETLKVLQDAPKRDGLPRVYVGCTGWSMKEWVGSVYPKGAKSTDYAQHYARQFNTIEFNTTHYRCPTVANVEKWAAAVPDDFRFAPKMLQTVSHAKNLGYGTGLTTEFCRAIEYFGEKLGVCFMQMPPHFKPDNLAVLEKYAAKFPKTVPLAVEIRGEEWFHTPQYFERFFGMLEHYGVSTVITDVAGRRDVLHQRLTTEKAVVRFVGNDLHPTDFQRIDAWVARLKTWFEAGLHEVYFFTHEPDNLKAPQLADYLVKKVQNAFPAQVRGPKFFNEIVNPQTSLF